MLHERIKRARILKGLSLQQVADALGDITKQALSKYEKGKDAPNSTRLIRLADVLGVKPEYFFRQSEVVLGSVDFRKHSTFGKRQQDSVKEQVREHLERYLAAESLFELEPEGLGARVWLHSIDVESPEEAEKAAETIRQRWNLGTNPIANLTEALEEHGVKVIGLKAHERFDGLCTEINNGRDAAIVSNLERPGERQRFNLAHELGHLVMRFPEEIHGTDIEEKLCHRFAGAFLFPGDQVIEAFGEHRGRIFIDEFLLAKREWGISIQAILRRLYDLNIVSQAVYQSTFRFWSSRGWRRSEPQPLASEESFRLRQLVYRALAEELVTPSRAAELLNTDLEEIEKVIANVGPDDGDQDVDEGSGL
ncbi:Zn-dependent peptidase ImmA, M78 family [Microbulbifer donghaiensis]|uniref:Zn-dependent peptidase ImmA, M78 family n=1 Tax=Microbulbifer donghaiensis TaxID=494016 RepID=A0A1M5IJU5_9GAMM|nr:XRE family transcriptional regulator [Microbulbifer donghaiensis]SHG28329.1 Zn-dependent peptidase ImmA, M78 family [Microbulbifer donghaiensis]